MQAAPSFTAQWWFLAFPTWSSLSPADHFLGFLISPSCSEIFSRLRISLRNCGTDKFLGSIGKIDGFFISSPWGWVAYILSTTEIFCSYFEHISVYTSPPFNGPKQLAGGTVGVQYCENHKPSPYAWLTSPLSPTKPWTIRILGNWLK